MKHLFIFGLGYSAQVLAREALARGFEVSGTTRSPEKLTLPGVRIHAFDDVPEAALSEATHILSSIAPQEKLGDIVLKRYGASIPSPQRGEGQGEGVFREYAPKPAQSMIEKSKNLRQQQTDVEKKLWQHLRSRQLGGFKFRRQEPIGNYVADFLCAEFKLIVELDGGQHALQVQYDEKRDTWLKSQDYKVFRIWNHEIVENLEGVLQAILAQLPPHPTLSPKGRGLLPWLGYFSTTGVYGDHQGAWVDEQTPPRPDNDRLRRRVEAEAAWQACGGHIFRLAGIYGSGRSAVDDVRAGDARRIDKQGQVFSRIHIADIAQTLLASMEKPNPGAIYNVCDNEPAASAEVVEFACALLNAPLPPLVPFEQAGLTAMGREFYRANRRVNNSRIREELAVSLRYPTYREGLKAIADGILA